MLCVFAWHKRFLFVLFDDRDTNTAAGASCAEGAAVAVLGHVHAATCGATVKRLGTQNAAVYAAADGFKIKSDRIAMLQFNRAAGVLNFNFAFTDYVFKINATRGIFDFNINRCGVLDLDSATAVVKFQFSVNAAENVNAAACVLGDQIAANAAVDFDTAAGVFDIERTRNTRYARNRTARVFQLCVGKHKAFTYLDATRSGSDIKQFIGSSRQINGDTIFLKTVQDADILIPSAIVGLFDGKNTVNEGDRVRKLFCFPALNAPLIPLDGKDLYTALDCVNFDLFGRFADVVDLDDVFDGVSVNGRLLQKYPPRSQEKRTDDKTDKCYDQCFFISLSPSEKQFEKSFEHCAGPLCAKLCQAQGRPQAENA